MASIFFMAESYTILATRVRRAPVLAAILPQRPPIPKMEVSIARIANPYRARVPPGLRFDQVQFRKRIVALAEFSRRFDHHYFKSRSDVCLQQMAAMGAAIGFPDDRVGVDFRHFLDLTQCRR